MPPGATSKPHFLESGAPGQIPFLPASLPGQTVATVPTPPEPTAQDVLAVTAVTDLVVCVADLSTRRAPLCTWPHTRWRECSQPAAAARLAGPGQRRGLPLHHSLQVLPACFLSPSSPDEDFAGQACLEAGDCTK